MRSRLFALALACLYLLAGTGQADALPLIPIVASFLAISEFAASLIVSGLALAASVGISYLTAALGKKKPDLTSLPGGTTGKLQGGGTIPRSIPFGTTLADISLVYANSCGADAMSAAATALGKTSAASGNTPCAYFHQVNAIADVPVTGLVELWVNGAKVTLDISGPQPVFEGWPIPEFNKDGKDYLWIRFYDGTQVAADPELVELFSGDPDRPYESTRVGTGVAYAVMTYLLNNDLFSGGHPQFKYVVQGAKFYDRRADSSAGGSGSQRWSDPSTWAYTSNPKVVEENILRGIFYGGKWLFGGQTVSSVQLPAASWMAAQNECDAAIDLLAGGTEPQFTVGGVITVDVSPLDVIDEINKACNGKTAEIGGVYKTRVGAAGAPVFSFTDANLLASEQQTANPFPSLGQTVNAIKATYISAPDGWVEKDAPPLFDATLEAADGGRRLVADVKYVLVSSGTQVQRLMKSERDTHRAFRNHTFALPPLGYLLEPLDTVSVTSARNGYVNKIFDITAGADTRALGVARIFTEVDPAAYDWNPATDEQPIVTGTIVPLVPPTQPILDWSVEAKTVTSDSGATIPAIKLNWDPNVDDVDGVFFQVRLKSSGEVLIDSVADNLSAGSIIISSNLLFNTQYEARGRYRPISSRTTSWSGWLTVTTPDARLILAALDAGLSDYISKLQAQMNEIATLAQGVANWTAEQLGKNEIDKQAMSVLASAQVGNALGLVQTLALAVASDEGAFASYQTTVSARFGTNESNITSLLASRTTDEAAFAAYQITTNASLGNLSASGIFQVIAGAGTDGASAVAKLQVSASLGGVFTDAGIELAAMVSGAGVKFSRTRLYAQSIQVGFPGVTGGDYVTPFAVQNRNGVPGIALQADLFPDNGLISRMVGPGAVESDNLIDSLDVIDSATNWNNSGAGKSIFGTVNVPVTAGSAVFIDFTYDGLTFPDGSVGTGTLSILIYAAGTLLRTCVIPSTTTVGLVHARTVIATGGSTAFDVKLLFTNTSGNRINVVTPKLTVREVKRSLVTTSAPPTPSVSYRTSLLGDTSASFLAADIGTAGAFRVVVVAIGWQTSAGASISGLTIGGVAAARHCYVEDQFGQGYRMSLYALRVTTGTTADIVATFVGSPHAVKISIWAVVAFSDTPALATVGYTTVGDTTDAPAALTTKSGQVLTAASFGAPSSSGFTPSWGGTDTPSERIDALTGTTPNAREAAWDMALSQSRSGNFNVAEVSASEAFVTVAALWQ